MDPHQNWLTPEQFLLNPNLHQSPSHPPTMFLTSAHSTCAVQRWLWCVRLCQDVLSPSHSLCRDVTAQLKTCELAAGCTDSVIMTGFFVKWYFIPLASERRDPERDGSVVTWRITDPSAKQGAVCSEEVMEPCNVHLEQNTSILCLSLMGFYCKVHESILSHWMASVCFGWFQAWPSRRLLLLQMCQTVQTALT